MAKDINRRGFFRIYDEVKLSYEKIDRDSVTADHHWQDAAEHDACNVSISAGGMAFNCAEALQEGDDLRIKITLIANGAVIVADGNVVYCKNDQCLDDEYPHLVGLCFVNIKAEERVLLTEYVAQRRLRHKRFGLFVLAVVAATALMPDVILGSLFELLHFLLEQVLELIHLAFEFIELAFDHLVEHVLDTDLHQTQEIVFYILMALILYGFYCLGRAGPAFFRACKKKLVISWARKKANLLMYWREQSLVEKIKVVTISIAVMMAYVFLGM